MKHVLEHIHSLLARETTPRDKGTSPPLKEAHHGAGPHLPSAVTCRVPPRAASHARAGPRHVPAPSTVAPAPGGAGARRRPTAGAEQHRRARLDGQPRTARRRDERGALPPWAGPGAGAPSGASPSAACLT